MQRKNYFALGRMPKMWSKKPETMNDRKWNSKTSVEGRKFAHVVAKKRRCLKCGIVFGSTDAGNRLCTHCRRRN